MAKPNQIKASDVSVAVDGVTIKRVQNFSVSEDIAQEELKELANAGVVQFLTQNPTVTIQIDTNEVGSTDTLALLADKMIPYNKAAVGFSTNEPRGGIYRHFIKAASSNATYRTITEQDMLYGYNTISWTLNQEGTQSARVGVAKHATLTAFDWSYDVNGNAAENYTLACDETRYYLNDWGNTRVYKPSFHQMRRTTAGMEFLALHSAIPNGSTVVGLVVNNQFLNRRRSGAAGWGVTGNCRLSSVAASKFFATSAVLTSTPWISTASNSTDRVWILYRGANDKTWEAQNVGDNPGWELESSGAAIGGIRRGQIKATLWNTNVQTKNTSTAQGRALRVQTINISGSFGEDQLLQLGTDGFYAISKQNPVPITVTCNLNDSDLEMYAMMVGTTLSANAVTGTRAVSSKDFLGTNQLKIEIYKDVNQTQLLKTVICNDLRPSSNNWSVGIGSNATHELTFACDNVRATGSGYNVTGGWETEF